MVKLFHTTYISVDLAHHEIFVLKLVSVEKTKNAQNLENVSFRN